LAVENWKVQSKRIPVRNSTMCFFKSFCLRSTSCCSLRFQLGGPASRNHCSLSSQNRAVRIAAFWAWFIGVVGVIGGGIDRCGEVLDARPKRNQPSSATRGLVRRRVYFKVLFC